MKTVGFGPFSNFKIYLVNRLIFLEACVSVWFLSRIKAESVALFCFPWSWGDCFAIKM
jgi:hypothetical protein